MHAWLCCGLWMGNETCRGQGLHGLRRRALHVGAAQAVRDPLQALELALDLWRDVRRRRDLPQAKRTVGAMMSSGKL